MLWRRDFDTLMDVIDNARLQPGSGYSKRGAKPTMRIQQDRVLAWSHGTHAMSQNITLTTREPVSNLPLVYYDDRWIEAQSQDYIEEVLCVSRQAYEWVRYLAEEQQVSCCDCRTANMTHIPFISRCIEGSQASIRRPLTLTNMYEHLRTAAIHERPHLVVNYVTALFLSVYNCIRFTAYK
jgi:hypothetical protein